jgi:hypothetical protein
MPTIDALMRSHEEGDITQGELFAHLISMLSPANMGDIRRTLGSDPARLVAFDIWLGELAHGGTVYLGRDAVALTDDAKEAIQSMRAATSAHGAHEAKGSAERPAVTRHQSSSRKSYFILENSLEDLTGVPFAAAHGEKDDHLRIIVLFAKYLGKPDDGDVKMCLAPNTPWSERLDAFEELLRRVQGRRPSHAFAGMLHPDAFPIGKPDEELWDDASFQQERRDLFSILLRSFERGGWILVRPEPKPEVTLALQGWGCIAQLSPSPGAAGDDEAELNRTMVGLGMSPATQALVRGLVHSGRLPARSAIRKLAAASPGMADVVAFETAYDALTISALETAERLALLRGPQVLNGAAGPFLLHEGDIDEHSLPRTAVEELVRGGWLGLGTDHTGHRCFALPEHLRNLIYERATMVDRHAVREQHRRLAKRDGPTVQDEVEAHYHAIAAGDEYLAIKTATYYGTDLRWLARALSEEAQRGDVDKFLRAAELYGTIVDRFDATDAYAWEYRGYNLARYFSKTKKPLSGEIRDKILQYYSKASALAENNPLYRGRELGFRARLGEDVGDEFRRLLGEFMRIGPMQGVFFATPVLLGPWEEGTQEVGTQKERLRQLAGPWLAELRKDKRFAELLA